MGIILNKTRNQMVRSTIAAALLFLTCDAVTLTTQTPTEMFRKFDLAIGVGSGIVNWDYVKQFKDEWPTVGIDDKKALIASLDCYQELQESTLDMMIEENYWWYSLAEKEAEYGRVY